MTYIVLFTKYYWSNQIGGACNTNRGTRNVYCTFVGKIKGKDHLGDKGV